jgi:BRCT domain type II-containing protein
MIENIITGKTIHFTGQFELNPQYCAERLGATVVKSTAPNTKRLLGPVDFVVAGRSPSSICLEQAQNLGIKVIDEKGFVEFVNLQDVRRNTRRPRPQNKKKQSASMPNGKKNVPKPREHGK